MGRWQIWVSASASRLASYNQLTAVFVAVTRRYYGLYGPERRSQQPLFNHKGIPLTDEPSKISSALSSVFEAMSPTFSQLVSSTSV